MTSIDYILIIRWLISNDILIIRCFTFLFIEPFHRIYLIKILFKIILSYSSKVNYWYHSWNLLCSTILLSFLLLKGLDKNIKSESRIWSWLRQPVDNILHESAFLSGLPPSSLLRLSRCFSLLVPTWLTQNSCVCHKVVFTCMLIKVGLAQCYNSLILVREISAIDLTVLASSENKIVFY